MTCMTLCNSHHVWPWAAEQRMHNSPSDLASVNRANNRRNVTDRYEVESCWMSERWRLAADFWSRTRTRRQPARGCCRLSTSLSWRDPTLSCTSHLLFWSSLCSWTETVPVSMVVIVIIIIIIIIIISSSSSTCTSCSKSNYKFDK